MKNKVNKIISLFLCLILIYSMGLSTIVYADDEQVVNTHRETDENFCKIKRTTATVTFNAFEKVKLYADYNINSDENYELVWSIDGKSYFLNGYNDQTTGAEAELRFLDDTTVKLQIISSNGEVFCEDELFMKSYINNGVSFWVNFEANFLMAIMIFIGIVGGTFGPWIGSLM